MNEVIGGLSTLNTRDYEDINRHYPPLNDSFHFVLRPEWRNSFRSRHDAQAHEILKGCPSPDPYDRFLYFTVLNYGRRFTSLFGVIHTYFCSVGLPVLDYDLLEFCLRLPLALKVHSRFYREMLVSEYPQMAPIPWSRNRLPLDSPKTRHFIIPFLERVRLLQYYVTRLSGGRIETLPRRSWSRRFRRETAFREFFLELLSSDRTLDRGYLSREGTQRLVELTDQGGDYYFKLIEKIATIELVLRELEVD
jgi:hypothetical protein